jgi:syntaxin 16
LFLVSELQASQERIFRLQFFEEENKKLWKNITKTENQLRKELRTVEKNIREYINDELLESKNDFEFKIKENMRQNILTEINSFSKKFKLEQEIFSKKCKELNLEPNENYNFIELNDISTNSSDHNENNNENFLMKEEPDEILQHRDIEIDKISKKMNNLQELFKDLNIIVIEQGTILDRIDYNIDITFDNVKKGKKHIVKANESNKGSCFRNAILFLILIVFVESCLLLFKFL